MSMLLIERGRWIAGKGHRESQNHPVCCGDSVAPILLALTLILCMYIVDFVRKAHNETDEATWNCIKLLFFPLGMLFVTLSLARNGSESSFLL